MGKERQIELHTRLTYSDVAGIIEALNEALKDGRLLIQKSDETLELPVPRVVDLDISAVEGEERTSFSLEISWRPNRPEIPDCIE